MYLDKLKQVTGQTTLLIPLYRMSDTIPINQLGVLQQNNQE